MSPIISHFPSPSSVSHILFIANALRVWARRDKSQPILATFTPSVIFASQKESLWPNLPQKKQNKDNRSYLKLKYDLLQENRICFFLFKGHLTSIWTLILIKFLFSLPKLEPSYSKKTPKKFPI
ncbi:hypothetical protein V6Z11_A11G063700 [Gossypium hirsutum]